jgi:choice-of-anchor B domain-containing protein
MKKPARSMVLLALLGLALPSAAHEDEATSGGAATGPAQFATACASGDAGGFSCSNVDLRAYLPLADFSTSRLSDIWGWTDPLTDVPYALVGTYEGVAFVSLADPDAPVLVGDLDGPTGNSLWGDIRVHQDHAFMVKEAAAHGLQVFDLNRLRGVTNPPVSFTGDARDTSFGSAHNVSTNPVTGLGIVAGSNTCSGGFRMFDLASPLLPSFLGCYSGDGYTHDVQCVIYTGPDSDHLGSEICFASNEDTLTIVDVTSRTSPVQLARESYPGVGYVHQGGLTPNQRYFIQGDELDEHDDGVDTRTYVWDVTDLDDPFVAGFHEASIPAIDHNLFVVGNHVFQASYRAGVRILRTGNLANAELAEVAHFDTITADDDADFGGVWGVHVFENGLVAATDIFGGLFVLDPDLEAVTQCADGIDNDSDGTVDHAGGPGGEAADAGCFGPGDPVEKAPPRPSGCGIGPELAPLMALLAALRVRRRR